MTPVYWSVIWIFCSGFRCLECFDFTDFQGTLVRHSLAARRQVKAQSFAKDCAGPWQKVPRGRATPLYTLAGELGVVHPIYSKRLFQSLFSILVIVNSQGREQDVPDP